MLTSGEHSRDEEAKHALNENDTKLSLLYTDLIHNLWQSKWDSQTNIKLHEIKSIIGPYFLTNAKVKEIKLDVA